MVKTITSPVSTGDFCLNYDLVDFCDYYDFAGT